MTAAPKTAFRISLAPVADAQDPIEAMFDQAESALLGSVEDNIWRALDDALVRAPAKVGQALAIARATVTDWTSRLRVQMGRHELHVTKVVVTDTAMVVRGKFVDGTKFMVALDFRAVTPIWPLQLSVSRFATVGARRVTFADFWECACDAYRLAKASE